MNKSYKNRGVTLIELVIVIAILGMSYLSVSILVRSYKWYGNEINTDYAGSSMMMFINRSKQYCSANKSSGYVLIDLVNSKMEFYTGFSKCIEVFKLPSGTKITRISGSNTRINIDKFGSTSDSKSIYYMDAFNVERKITLRVGSEYLHVYD